MRTYLTLLATWMVLSLLARPAAGQPALREYVTRYYVIHTDLGEDLVREAAARMTAMAEEYHQRTRSFSGTIRRPFPFYLFARQGDYLAAGGHAGSVGMYVGDGKKGKLMALGSLPGYRLWYVVQHEGFHQFANVVIGDLPVWLNEGLADYFGVALWTGDGFATGFVPPDKLARVRWMIQNDQLLPFGEMLAISNTAWRSRGDTRHYDQAWSMVHFLVHGEDGRFQAGLSAFIAAVAKGQDRQSAWSANLPGAAIFQKRYSDWWLAQDLDPSRLVWRKATVATLTSYVARATQQGLRLEKAEEFFAAAGEGKIANLPSAWLPPSLLARALKSAQRDKGWSLTNRSSPQANNGKAKTAPATTAPSPGAGKTAPAPAAPVLVLQLDDGTTFRGTFSIAKERIETQVTVEKPKGPKGK